MSGTHENPLVSVVLPVFNDAEYLRQALTSVEIARSFGDRIRLILQDNAGAAVARNRGIEASLGSLVAFLDSDDVWLPEKLDLQVRHLARNPEIDLVFSHWWNWLPGPDGRFVFPHSVVAATRDEALDTKQSGWLYNQLLMKSVIQTSTVVMRRGLIEKIGEFDRQLLRGQDYDYWIRASRLTRIHKLRSVLALYRIRKPPIHATNFEYLLKKKALDRWGNTGPDGTVTDPHEIDRALTKSWFGHGCLHYGCGDPKIACRAFARCVWQGRDSGRDRL